MVNDYVDVRLESGDFPCDGLQVHTLTGIEEIGQLFRFDLEVVTTAPAGLDLAGVIGANATIVFERAGVLQRHVHGMVCEVQERLDTQGEARAYQLCIVPRAYKLSLVETQEIFLDMTVPEIIEQKLAQVGLVGADYELRLNASYEAREFTVQYKETDLAFVSRLAEHLGIAIVFDHDTGCDRVIFSDQQASLPDVGEALLRKQGDQRDVYRLDVRTKVIPATYAVNDYNYRTPQVDLNDGSVFDLPHPDCLGGVVEYGTHVKTPAEGQWLAQVRAEERQATRRVYRGKSDLPAFLAGGRFTLDGPHDLDDPTMLLVAVEHKASRPAAAFGGTQTERHYDNSFRAVPGSQTYRPQRATPRPRIHGVVSAVITHGIEQGTERWAKIDDQGRYTARFMFDTAEHDGRQSRWIRMLKPHTGPNYGIHFPLKPGMEVLMTFVDGDPDRPLIVGCAYRPDTPSPVRAGDPLDNHTINKIKSESGVIIEIHDA